MLRPFAVALVLSLALAGCGSSSSPAASPGPQGPVSGTVLGQPFTAADASALALSQGTCTFGATSATATGLLVGFGSFAGLCSFVGQNGLCGTKASATIVSVVLVRANPSGSPGPVQPGTYPIGGIPAPDAQGNVNVARAELTRTDASCNAPASLPSVTSGTVRVSAVGARTAGSVDLAFSDGGHVSGAFDVPTCTGFQADVCSALAPSCPAGMACVP